MRAPTLTRALALTLTRCETAVEEVCTGWKPSPAMEVTQALTLTLSLSLGLCLSLTLSLCLSLRLSLTLTPTLTL